jgi:hypothetical protein
MCDVVSGLVQGAFPRFTNLAKPLGLDYFGAAGTFFAEDFNGDGLLDVFQCACQQWPKARITTRLLLNKGDGTFNDTTDDSGLAMYMNGWNAKQADYDNDGDLDLLILRGGWAPIFDVPNTLHRNNGDGTFEEVTDLAGVASSQGSHSAAWGDYDLDGHLDLIVACEQNPCHLWHNSGHENDKGPRFIDMAKEYGLQNCGWAKAVAWGDYNNDGYPDLLISRWGQPNLMWKNKGHVIDVVTKKPKFAGFEEVAVEAGLTEPVASFSISWFDFDNDGWEDVLVEGNSNGAPGEFYSQYMGTPWKEQPMMQDVWGIPVGSDLHPGRTRLVR